MIDLLEVRNDVVAGIGGYYDAHPHEFTAFVVLAVIIATLLVLRYLDRPLKVGQGKRKMGRRQRRRWVKRQYVEIIDEALANEWASGKRGLQLHEINEVHRIVARATGLYDLMTRHVPVESDTKLLKFVLKAKRSNKLLSLDKPEPVKAKPVKVKFKNQVEALLAGAPWHGKTT